MASVTVKSKGSVLMSLVGRQCCDGARKLENGVRVLITIHKDTTPVGDGAILLATHKSTGVVSMNLADLQCCDGSREMEDGVKAQITR